MLLLLLAEPKGRAPGAIAVSNLTSALKAKESGLFFVLSHYTNQGFYSKPKGKYSARNMDCLKVTKL